jgi:hypothetical protein
MLLFRFIAGYAVESLARCEGVCNWLKDFGPEYHRYVSIFEGHMIDGFWLLNYVNEESLIKYEIKNEHHRKRILSGIEELKKQCEAERSAKKN